MRITIKHRVIKAGFALFALSRLYRILAPLTRGHGAILTFHHVRPWQPDDFAPNRLLEITPDFLDRLLTHLKATGYRFVALDDVLDTLDEPNCDPFVVLTFDDGYRSVLRDALPLLERHGAPFTIYATTGFLNRAARLWWVELEEAVRRLSLVDLGAGRSFVTETAAQKGKAFASLAKILGRESDAERLAVVERIAAMARFDGRRAVDSLCMDWDELIALSAHPLVTVGAHTITHPRLARLSRPEAMQEMAEGRGELERRLGRAVRHLAYPYGGRDAATSREFALARESGFATATTTRPGVLVPGHRHHPTALPRLSMNGLWQTTEAADILLSGAPSALWNRGRRLTVA